MKKFYLALLTFLLVFCVTGCELLEKVPFLNKTEVTSQQTQAQAQKPTISGAKDVTIHVGDKFRPMDGITAKDADGNEISANDISYSGNVDVKTPGVYQATYTVSDKNGVTNSVTITVTVIALDEEAPLLTGVGNVDVVVTQPFDKMAGVSANDTVDGNLTSAIVATGDVDYKHIGTYKVEYKVSDKTGNESVKTRTVNVTVGAFKFDAETKAQTLEVSATLDPKSKYSYGLVQVNYTAEAEATVKVKLGSYEVETKHAAAGTYAQYVPYSSALDKAQLEVTGATFVSYIVGDAADVVAPTFTGDFTKTVAISKDHKDAAVQFIIDMCGAKAKDDRDGFITDKITANFEGINWDSKEEQTLTLEVLDLAGNKGTQQVKVVVNAETELADFMDSLEAIVNGETPEYSDYNRNATLSQGTKDDAGSVKIGDLTSGGYWSFGMVRFVLSDLVTEGNYYVLKITARAGLEESTGQLTQGISYRIGGSLDAEPWYYEFKGCSVGGNTYGENRMNLTSEYQTIYRIFKADFRDENASIEDCFGVKMEFQFTPQEWVTVYPIYVKEFSISLLSNEDQAPVLKQDTSKPTVLVVGDTIDLSSYFTATDLEDGNLAVTVDGTVDMTKKGFNTVKFSTVDSKGHKVEQSLVFEVLTEKDTTAPTITFSGANPYEILVDSITTEQALQALASMLTIKDTKNGDEYDIVLSDATVNVGNFDMSVPGKYTIKVSAKDSSGNVGELQIVVKVFKESTGDGQYELLSDYLNQTFTQENVTTVKNEGVLEIIPTTFAGGGWASFNKSKFELMAAFEEGKKYKFVVEAKADVARTIKATFSAAESTWSKYGSVGFVQCDLGTEYEKFEVEFTYTGKFTKDEAEYKIAYVALELQVGNINWAAGETVDNKVYIKTMSLYEAVEGTPAGNYMNQTFTQENVTTVKNDKGILEVLPTTFEKGGWASFNKSKFELLQNFVVGRKYKLVVIAKADEARKIAFSFGCAEGTWSKYGSVGKLECDLTSDYQRFEFEFTYTGKFTKDETEYDVAYAALELQVGNIDWSAGESITNKVYVKKIDLYDVTEPTLVGNYMNQTYTQENLTATMNEGTLELLPTTFEKGGWASFNKSKFEMISPLEVGKTYKLVVEAKADEARKIAFSFGCAEGTWSKYGSVGKLECDLETEYEKYEFEFTYTGKFTKDETEYDVAYVALELQIGNINWSAGESLTNKVYVKTIELYEMP